MMTYSEMLQDRLAKNPFYKYTDVVTEILRDDIISFRIRPEPRLSVNALAEAFAVSRTPVLEALSKLEAIGFVYKEAHAKSYYVSSLDISDLMCLYRARAAIEGEAAYRCAIYADDRTLRKLETLLPGY